MKILSVCLFSALVGCGFKPLYSKETGQSSEILQQVNISDISGRDGQILQNYLLDMLNPAGRPKKAPYRLSSTITISSSSLGVQSDATTTRQSSSISVAFVLSGNEINESFTIINKSGFSQTDNVYATSVAEKDAINSGLRQVAEGAKLRIAAILKRYK